MNKICIDWLSFTVHKSKEDMRSLVPVFLNNWDEWSLVSGRLGYTEGGKHDIGVKVFQNHDRTDMGKHVIYSGGTLRKISMIHDKSAIDILNHHLGQRANIARIDIAIDFIHTGLTVKTFRDAFMDGLCITRLKSASEILNLTESGHTFYIGSRKTRRKLVRIYDKQAESELDYPCIRVELQLMGKPATQVGKDIVKGDNAISVMLTALKSVVDFPFINDWNKVFINSETMQLETHHLESSKTRYWLENQVRTAIINEAALDCSWWLQYKMFIDDEIVRKSKEKSSVG